MKHIPQTSFFPGNNLLLEKATIHTTSDDAAAVQLQVGSDLTTMKTFSFDTWRPIIASRYAADPLVMELLAKLENAQTVILGLRNRLELAIKINAYAEDSNLADEPQTWQSIFP